MSKRVMIAFLAFVLLAAGMDSALALHFTGRTGNSATFETLEQAHANASAVVSTYSGNEGRAFTGHPALDEYPQNTTYVYRSADMYGGRANARMNTNLIVCVDRRFDGTDSAYAYLKDAGLIDIIDEATGSIVLMTPAGERFAKEDIAAYYALQTAMLAQKDYTITESGNLYYADAEYFGGYGYFYFIGIDGGATFFNNHIATTFDFVSRIAGALLFGGEMEEIRQVAACVPVYLVGADSLTVERYKSANDVDAVRGDRDRVTWYQEALPLQRVTVAPSADKSLPQLIQDAYYGMFIKAMRVPVVLQGMYSAGTPYSGYNFDQAPYSLNERNALIGGRTADGVVLISHQGDERFAELQEQSGEYIDTWYEYMPCEALDGTAPLGSIPLILCLHGAGDDGRMFVDEMGFLTIAGMERVAVVAPDHQNIKDHVPALSALIESMLKTYPALDASRVYAVGYSYGGYATCALGSHKPELLAAIAPMAATDYVPGSGVATNFKNRELPILLTTSSYDARRLAKNNGRINDNLADQINRWAGYNKLAQVDFDFSAHPLSGFSGDSWMIETLNGEVESRTWYLENQEGAPMVALNYVKDLVHALYPQYGTIAWNYMKQFSRDLETGDILYHPNCK